MIEAYGALLSLPNLQGIRLDVYVYMYVSCDKDV